jgi:hypothetical protein
MRSVALSVAAMVAVTALFAGILVGGLSYTGALDPALLHGAKEDHPGAARAGWETHSLPKSGFSIQLPPGWEMTKVNRSVVVFEEHKGKAVLASLTVARALKGAQEGQAPTSKRFLRGDRALTFKTSQELAASYNRVFDQAAGTYKQLGSA